MKDSRASNNSAESIDRKNFPVGDYRKTRVLENGAGFSVGEGFPSKKNRRAGRIHRKENQGAVDGGAGRMQP